ncbi:MAG: TetR-like C-terminal domain-containing protein, partial [Raoultibacter sp.]
HNYYIRHFEYIFEHASFFKTMFGQHGPTVFHQKFEESAYVTYQDIFLQSQTHAIDRSMDYFIQYIISAHIGITTKWIKDGMQETPIFMAELLTNMTFRGLLRGLEMDQQVVLPQ